MDVRTAVISYQYGERIKSEMILASNLITVLSGLKDSEYEGGRKVVLQYLDGVRNDLSFAFHETKNHEFSKASDPLSQAVSLVESGTPDPALAMIGTAITAVTTVAQGAWQELVAHGYL